MQVRVIETIEHKIPKVPLPGEEEYTFAGTRPFVRLKRWLWERWGKPSEDIEIVATRHLIDIHEEKFGTLIFKALRKLGLRLDDIECIIAGPSDVAKHEFQVMQHRWDFNFPMVESSHRQWEVMGKSSYRQWEVMGIRIKVIPWVSEIIIVPKERK